MRDEFRHLPEGQRNTHIRQNIKQNPRPRIIMSRTAPALRTTVEIEETVEDSLGPGHGGAYDAPDGRGRGGGYVSGVEVDEL